MLDKVNFDKWADHYSRILGVETDIVVDDDNVLALRKARAEAEAAQAQIAAGREMAAGAKDMGSVKTDEPNMMTDALSSGVAQEEV